MTGWFCQYRSLHRGALLTARTPNARQRAPRSGCPGHPATLPALPVSRRCRHSPARPVPGHSTAPGPQAPSARPVYHETHLCRGPPATPSAIRSPSPSNQRIALTIGGISFTPARSPVTRAFIGQHLSHYWCISKRRPDRNGGCG